MADVGGLGTLSKENLRPEAAGTPSEPGTRTTPAQEACFPLSTAVEFAFSTLADAFELEDDSNFTLLLLHDASHSTRGSVIAEPVKLHLKFPGGAIEHHPPTAEVSFGGYGRSRLTDGFGSSNRQNPYDRLLYQIRQILLAQLRSIWPLPDARSAQRIFKTIHSYLDHRLATLTSHCIVCDAHLPYPGPKPAPCHSPVCTFAFDEMGCGSGLGELYQCPAAADLLIAFAAAAALCPRAPRRQKLFATVPASFVIQPARAGMEPVLDWTRMHSTLTTLPAMDDLVQAKFIEALLTREQFTLVRWVLSTNRSHLAPLGEAECLPEMRTPHQFRLTLSSSSHAASFAAAKAARGSFLAFHGSHFYNWHSILRTGLRNCSDTPMMSNGASFGLGIYLSPSSARSLCYSHACEGWPGSRLGSAPVCLALCEVINGAPTVHNDYTIVVPDEAHVITRYLFVYDSPASAQLPVSISAAHLCVPDAPPLAHIPRHWPATPSRSAGDNDSNLQSLCPSSNAGATNTADITLGHDAINSRAPASTQQNPGTANSALVSCKHPRQLPDASASKAPLADDALEQRKRARLMRGPELAATAARVLVKELHTLSKTDTLAEGFEVHPVDPSDLTLWEAKLYLREGSLASQLQDYAQLHGQGYMKLRLRFPAEYPISPPFVWVVSPRLQYRTGFVSRGAICTTMLVSTGTSAGWSASYTIDKVLMVIRCNLQDPQARGQIQDIRVHREYSEQEARQGFAHAKALHGW